MVNKLDNKQGRYRLRASLGLLFICGLSLSMSGCIIGPIIGQFTGRPSETVKVKAKYKLRGGNLLVLVDNRVSETQSSGVQAVLSRELLGVAHSPHFIYLGVQSGDCWNGLLRQMISPLCPLLGRRWLD